MPISSPIQFKTKAGRFLGKIDAASMEEGTFVSILKVAKSTLTLLSSTSDSNTYSHSSVMPDLQDIETFMKKLLPTYNVIFTEHFFNSPLFQTSALCDVAKTFGFEDKSHALVKKPDTSQAEKKNKRVMLPIWFSHFLNCDTSVLKSVVTRNLSSRRSATMLTHFQAHDRFESSKEYNQCIPHPPFQTQQAPRREDLDIREITVITDETTMGIPATFARSAPGHPNNSRLLLILTPTYEANHELAHDSDNDESQKSNKVQQMFKENKFSGDLTQDINETIQLVVLWVGTVHPIGEHER